MELSRNVVGLRIVTSEEHGIDLSGCSGAGGGGWREAQAAHDESLDAESLSAPAPRRRPPPAGAMLKVAYGLMSPHCVAIVPPPAPERTSTTQCHKKYIKIRVWVSHDHTSVHKYVQFHSVLYYTHIITSL